MTDFVTPPVWSNNDVPLLAANIQKHSDNDNYFKEVLAGTNADKIPGTAMNRQNAIWNYTLQSGNYSVPSWGYIILVDASGGSRTITLPSASASEGSVIIVKKWDSSLNTVVVAVQSGQYIDNVQNGTFTLYSQYDSVTIMSLGAGASNIHTVVV